MGAAPGPRSEPVQGVERGDLVGVDEGRVVAPAADDDEVVRESVLVLSSRLVITEPELEQALDEVEAAGTG
jgi:hypothetical protein